MVAETSFPMAASDGPPRVKTIWIGLMKLYILLAYREYLV
jgi:hypothetical protein